MPRLGEQLKNALGPLFEMERLQVGREIKIRLIIRGSNYVRFDFTLQKSQRSPELSQ